MDEEIKYLDYEGLNIYHNKLLHQRQEDVQSVVDMELTIAAALNDLELRKSNSSDIISELENDERVISESLNDLNERVDNIKENVQADWNATEGDAAILNRPDITTTNIDGMTLITTASGGQFAVGQDTNNFIAFSEQGTFVNSTNGETVIGTEHGNVQIMTDRKAYYAAWGDSLTDDKEIAVKGDIPTKVSDLENNVPYATKAEMETIEATKANTADLATVATTGSYNDLKNKPTILDIPEIVDSNGHEYVDLGLPSGTLWATCNIGATNPEDYGDYFAWGETRGYNGGKTKFSWDNYTWYNKTSSNIKKYCTDSSHGYNGFIDNKTELDLEDDAAYVKWGPAWRMPNNEQFEELMNSEYTTNTWTTQNYVRGRLITSKSNGNSIFLPAAGDCTLSSQGGRGSFGYYWSRSLNESDPTKAYTLGFNSNSISTNTGDRWIGSSVRPVNISAIPTSFHKVAITGDYNDLENKPTNVSAFNNDVSYVTEDEIKIDKIDANGHEYVEIAGIKWATMNVGAQTETNYGLYFAWGETQGYADASTKAFSWSDYKWTEDGGSTFTKYNETDGKTVLDLEDDAVAANWGGTWRMPTTEELQALGNAVNAVWTTDYNGSGINGLLCTDKTDSTKKLFFPASGTASNGSRDFVGNGGRVWSSSLFSGDMGYAWSLSFGAEVAQWNNRPSRYNGVSVRGVLDTAKVDKYATKEELNTTTNDLQELIEAAKNCINVTYSEIVALRNTDKLISGQWYRITDYVATTTGTGTRSANHPFDVLVQAIDGSHLKEDAYAALHEGDTYFANSKLEAWKLNYCLDNNTERFGWADTENGKGVIYRMIDEFSNDVYYDFKGILIRLYKVTNRNSDTAYANLINKYVVAIGEDYSYSETYEKWNYTFDNNGLDRSITGILCGNNLITKNAYSLGISCNVFCGPAINNKLYSSSGNTFIDYCDNNEFNSSSGSVYCSILLNNILYSCNDLKIEGGCNHNIMSYFNSNNISGSISGNNITNCSGWKILGNVTNNCAKGSSGLSCKGEVDNNYISYSNSMVFTGTGSYIKNNYAVYANSISGTSYLENNKLIDISSSTFNGSVKNNDIISSPGANYNGNVTGNIIKNSSGSKYNGDTYNNIIISSGGCTYNGTTDNNIIINANFTVYGLIGSVLKGFGGITFMGKLSGGPYQIINCNISYPSGLDGKTISLTGGGHNTLRGVTFDLTQLTTSQDIAVQPNTTRITTNGTDIIQLGPTHIIDSPSVRNIVLITQAEYDALTTKDPNTEYNIIETT